MKEKSLYSSPRNQLKVGIVGCGHIATVHIPILKRLRNSQVTSVCDLDPHKAKTIADLYNIPKVYSDLALMGNKDGIDQLMQKEERLAPDAKLLYDKDNIKVYEIDS